MYLLRVLRDWFSVLVTSVEICEINYLVFVFNNQLKTTLKSSRVNVYSISSYL